MTGHGGSPPNRRAADAARRQQRAAITDPAIVMEAAARFLAVRSRSVAETRRRLLSLGYPEGLTEDVLERLGRMGYLDDQAFARAWVESRDRARPRGAAALREELRRLGVDDATVRDALHGRASPVPTGPGEQGAQGADRAAADRLLARRATALAREPDPRRRHQKAYALLARHGFDPDTCRSAAAGLAASAAAGVGPDPGPAWDRRENEG